MLNKKLTGSLLFWGKLSLALCLVILNIGVTLAECDSNTTTCVDPANPSQPMPDTSQQSSVNVPPAENYTPYDSDEDSQGFGTREKTSNPSTPKPASNSSTPAPAADTPATPPSPPADPTSSSATGMNQFNVGQYLTVNDTKQTTDSINVKVDNLGLQGGQDQAYLKSNNPVGAFILQIINLIALTAASLSFLAVVIAGFLMMSAAGEVNQLNRGKDILTKALVGLVITLSAYFIVAFVQNLLFETI